MNRLLLTAVLAIALAACGGKETPTGQTAEAPPAATTTPVEPSEPSAQPKAEGEAVAELASDGETVDEATSAVSPIAAAVAANTPAPTPASPSKFRAGQHYALLPVAQPVSVEPGRVEVTEIFWYGCGHCFTLEPRIEAWEKQGKPDYVDVVRMPVVWNEVTREDARLFYTLQALGKLDELHLAVFRELHVNRNPLTVIAGNRIDATATENKVREFLATHGVSAEEFGRVYRSFATESKIRQAENLSRRYLADHTPMVVVQGKYQTDVSMAGGVEPLFAVVGELAERERAATR
jgi:thiol:disulfide interchange protein DsbA